ncbi:MAG: hypothetical protein KDA63_21050 [Planctomycetales bacterium]|nr:hypothetical protein [Planctomycetales bacterium]
MQHVVNPTFPRSGHHLLQRLVCGTLGDQVVYSERYASQALADPTRPLYWEKSHDYHLVEWHPDRDDVMFVVQYRTCLESIVSDFEIRVVASDELTRAYESVDAHFDLKMDLASWEFFADWASDYWRAFVEKWVMPFRHHARRNIHLLEYSHLVRDPQSEVSGLLQRLGIPRRDLGALPQVIASEQVRGRRDLRAFEFFDTTATRRAEAKVQPLLESLGLRQYTTHAPGVRAFHEAHGVGPVPTPHLQGKASRATALRIADGRGSR